MTNLKELKTTSLEFSRIASNMLRTEYTNQDVPLHRFKNYIDTNDTIKNIVQSAIENIDYDYKNCFEKEPSDWAEINVPVNEKEHLRAMYDYMTYIVDEKKSVFHEAASYMCSSRKITDIIQNFLSLAFKPLVDYIIDELSKMIMLEEEIEMKKIEVNANNSIVNMADNNSSISSNNTITVNQNDLKEINNLILDLKEKIDNVNVSSEEKDDFIDDLDVIQEQLNEQSYKPTRFKKAFNNVKTFLSNSALLTGAGITLATNVNKLIELVQPIIDKF